MCGCAESARPDVGAHRAAITDENDLSENRLALNRLALNRLALNRLALNRLALNRLALNDLTDLHHDPDGREVLEYVASCALEEGDVLVAVHDGVTYEFPGLLGLASGWEHEPLKITEKRIVSACLLSHVNAFGESVKISVRTPYALTFDDAERLEYTVYEGTFFGDVFSDDQQMFACQGHWPLVAKQQTPTRAVRVCTDPTPECGIESVGRCRDVCETYTHQFGWQNCRGGGELYAETVSVWLARDGAGSRDASCDDADGNCKLECDDGGAATLDCTGSEHHRCKAKCVDGSACTVACSPDNDRCKTKCKRGSACEIDCIEARDCRAKCKRGSLCEIDCLMADECHRVDCESGAACLLRCTDAVTCGFRECTGGSGEQSCPGGVVVCNRPCP